MQYAWYNAAQASAEVWMQRIRALRAERGLTQVRLAVAADMNPATLNRIEQGKANPNLKTLERLAEALGVGLVDLLVDDSPKAQAPLPLDDVAGSELLRKALEAARQDEEQDTHAIARLGASEGMTQSVSGYAEDAFRAELRELGFPDEYFEDFLWPLVQKAYMTVQLETVIGVAFPEDEQKTVMERVFRRSLEDARS